jgi:hypothetical protein
VVGEFSGVALTKLLIVKGLVFVYMHMYVDSMTHISIRDLQKLSGETIGALPGPTPVKSGDRTVGAKGRDVAADDAALAAFGEVDPVDWSVEAVRALMAKRV